MSSPDKKFYVTTPIYYVNARPHIGHAYTTVVADVVARRHRLLGDRTWLLTGTDEHGQKIERSAAAANIPPQQFTDQVSQSFQDLWRRMGITHDDFIRTTDPRHKAGAQKLFAELYARGEIYLSSYTGQYCVSEEMFVEGPPGTIGPDGRPTETVTEENFFFRLSNYQLDLLNLIENGPNGEEPKLRITPEARRNEVLSFLRGNVAEATTHPPVILSKAKDPLLPAVANQPSNEQPDAPGLASETWVGAPLLTSPPSAIDTPGAPSMAQSHRDMGGITDPEPATSQIAHTAAGTPYLPGALKDLSVSRSSFTWGIPVPEPAASAAKDPHVIYVWLDALANYMTALGYGSDDESRFHEFWPADLHLVGKEIIRFHCVYWPAFLLAAGLPLPKSVVAHGWLLFEESKMSKSRGNIVRTETILDAFGDHYRRELTRLARASSDKRTDDPNSQTPSSRPEAEGRSGEIPASRSSEPTKADADLFASDILRYFLLREIPFGQDGSFSFDAMITRYNADLANGYGNLVSRVLSLIAKYFGGVVTGGSAGTLPVSVDDAQFLRLRQLCLEFEGDSSIFGITMDAVDPIGFDQSRGPDWFLKHLGTFLATADAFMTSSAPWKLASSAIDMSRELLASILYAAAEAIRILTALLYPILPYSTAKVWAQLGLGDIEQAAHEGKLTNLQWGGLPPGTKLGPLAPIFPRAPKELAQIMTDAEIKPSLTQVTADNDAATSEASQFPEAPISDLAPTANPDTTKPGATRPGAPEPALSSPKGLASETWEVAAQTADRAALEPTSPAAPPRTSTLPHHDPGSQVGASSAPAAVLPRTPSHVDAEPSGVFAGSAAAIPITATPATPVPQITIDDFAKVELRVAKILVAERIPKADKLLRLEVDLGPALGQRQILSGIAEWYPPESLVGRKIVVITNLAPRKMRGLESHGMLLAASHGEDGKPVLATFAEDIEVGARLK